MKAAIIIPARYGSTRFPGKPLAKIAGKTMLSRVVDVAKEAAEDFGSIEILITTDDQRIADHAAEIDVACAMTAADISTGTDRVFAALPALKNKPDFVLNLQGDAPLTPPAVLRSVIAAFEKNPKIEVVTPCHRLSWDELDALRKNKETTPFSGTTVTMDKTGKALWFSKNIIPAIRKENRDEPDSPVHQHIGLYGFRTDVLKTFVSLPPGHYEQLEGLEQLRLLENGISIHCVVVEDAAIGSGIDTPEDLARAEELLKGAA